MLYLWAMNTKPDAVNAGDARFVFSHPFAAMG